MADKNNSNPEQKEDSSKKEMPIYAQSLEQIREKSNEKQLMDIEKEREQMDHMQRFGYFSIPYAAVIGDKAYSRKKEFNHQIVDRQVITEKRGIFTQPPKTGKCIDAYFSPVEPESKETIALHKQQNKEEKEQRAKEIKMQKEQKPFKASFKPGGPQILFGYYQDMDKNIKREGPLYQDKDRFHMIDKENRSIFFPRRGIYPSIGHFNKNPLPADLFSYPKLDNELEQKYKKISDEDKLNRKKMVRSKSEGVYKKPFAPAALKKNEPFSTDKETYAQYDDATIKKILEENQEIKKKGRPKYQKILPSGALKHQMPFHPAKLVSTGRDGLFNDDLYKIPRVPEEKKEFRPIREIREEERKRYKSPFVFNRLMNHSQFSPSLYSNPINLKREFPSVFIH
ncbi:MAG: hypothetical protein MJ252_10075 [archaeon]|nr:hypothetical protein [archaeon]